MGWQDQGQQDHGWFGTGIGSRASAHAPKMSLPSPAHALEGAEATMNVWQNASICCHPLRMIQEARCFSRAIGSAGMVTDGQRNG